MLELRHILVVWPLVLTVAACERNSNEMGPSGNGASAGNAGADASAGTSGGGAAGAAPQVTRCSEDAGSNGSAGASGQSGGTPGPSCNGLPATCGPQGDDDCCASSVVPGGTFYRSYDGVTHTDNTNPATVSDFRLDTYEITVGRFRKFVEVYAQDMIPAGAGKNPNDPNDPGWQTEWNAELPADAATLTAPYDWGQVWPPNWHTVNCSDNPVWTDAPGANEDLPIDCLTWYLAQAFCIWDGARLPTEAEWNYAAAGGCEQRAHPWSSPPDDTTVDESYAVYDRAYPGGRPERVGSKSPQGDGRWGHADLVGNIDEWVADWYGPYPNPCVDCMNLTPQVFEIAPASSPLGPLIYTRRVLRGGSWRSMATDEDSGAVIDFWLGTVAVRGGSAPLGEVAPWTRNDGGARCARSP